MTIEAMTQALDALQTNNKAWKQLADSGDAGFWEAEEQPFYETSAKAITALRAAIEQAQANDFNPDWDAMAVMVAEQQRLAKRIAELEAQPDQEPVQELVCVCGAIWEGQELVSAPSQRKWQWLTDDEAIDLLPVGAWDIESTLEFAKAIEEKLKEKNNA